MNNIQFNNPSLHRIPSSHVNGNFPSLLEKQQYLHNLKQQKQEQNIQLLDSQIFALQNQLNHIQNKQSLKYCSTMDQSHHIPNVSINQNSYYTQNQKSSVLYQKQPLYNNNQQGQFGNYIYRERLAYQRGQQDQQNTILIKENNKHNNQYTGSQNKKLYKEVIEILDEEDSFQQMEKVKEDECLVIDQNQFNNNTAADNGNKEDEIVCTEQNLETIDIVSENSNLQINDGIQQKQQNKKKEQPNNNQSQSIELYSPFQELQQNEDNEDEDQISEEEEESFSSDNEQISEDQNFLKIKQGEEFQIPFMKEKNKKVQMIQQQFFSDNSTTLEKQTDADTYPSQQVQQQQQQQEEEEKKKETKASSKGSNKNKLLFNQIIKCYSEENILNLDADNKTLCEIFLTTERCRKTGIRYQHTRRTTKTDNFNHSHYRLLFMKINEQNFYFIRNLQKDVKLHKYVFNFNLQRYKEFKYIPVQYLQKVNRIKENIYKVFLAHIQNNLIQKIKEIENSEYEMRALQGIKLLNEYKFITRF